MIRTKRIYDAASQEDGFRILVDRLWPRGISKEKAKIDLWLREIAPEDALRKWFAHDPKKWVGFKEKYFKDLGSKKSLAAEIVKRARAGVTLVYAAKDIQHNNAVALKEYLESKL